MARTDWVDGQDVDAPSMNSLGAEVNGKQTALPLQTGHAGESLHTNGTTLLWSPDTGGGGGATNLSVTRTPTQVVVASDTGDDAILLAADGTNAGIMTVAQQVALTGKLDTSAAPELIRDTMGTALVQGANITITPNDAGDTITIAAAGGAGATNLTTTRTATTMTVLSDTGTDATLVAADGTNAGVMTAAQQVLLTGAIQTSTKNVANGVLGLNASGLANPAQLPSYVDDVLEFANFAAFPGTGETGKIYVAINSPPTTPSTEWRWSGTVYTQMVSSPGTTDAVTEGTTNLYYTNARADARVVAGITGKLDTSAAPELIRDTIGTALVAGTNVTITPNDAGDTIAISATPGAGSTNLTTTLAPTQVTVLSDTGSDAIIPAADGTNAGVMTAAQQIALAGKLDTSAAPELIRDTMGTALTAGANVTITPNDVGDIITIAATGSGGGSSTVFNVKSAPYNALGNDTGNDATAIQAAISAASAAGGGTVYFPAGTYRCTAQIVLVNNVSLLGDGASFVTGGSRIKQVTAGQNILYMATTTVPKGALETRNLVLEHAAITGTAHGIYLDNASGTATHPPFVSMSFRDLFIQGCTGYGFNAESLITSVVERVTCQNNGGGFYLNGDAYGSSSWSSVNTSVTFTGCYANGNTGIGYNLKRSTYSAMNGCAADSNGAQYVLETCQAIVLNGCGAEYGAAETPSPGDSYTIKGGSAGIVLDGCLALNNMHYSVWVTGGSTATVTGFMDSDQGPSAVNGLKVDIDSKATELGANTWTGSVSRPAQPFTIIDGAGAIGTQMDSPQFITPKITGTSGYMKFNASLDANEYNLGVSTTGTLALFGETPAASLDLNLSDGVLKTGNVTRMTNAGGIVKRRATFTNIASMTVNADTTDVAENTGLTTAVTVNNPTGTPTAGQELVIALTGTAARAITWSTATNGFEPSAIALPTTTVTTARLDASFRWNTATSKWRLFSLTAPAGGGSGDVVGPASATDNAIARYDLTTGKLLQTSLASVDDSGNLSALNAFLGIQSQATTGTSVVLTVASPRIQERTGTTAQTDRLPTTNVPQGAEWEFRNSTSATLTVQSSGANTVLAMPAGYRAIFRALVATPTTAANWLVLHILPVPGTSGNVATSNGTVWASAAPPTGTLPSQTGHSGEYLTTNGTTAAWGTVSSGGGGSMPNVIDDFGADPDGAVSSGNAFRNAAAAGGAIRVPAGNYIFDGAPLTTDNLILHGDGPGQTTINISAGNRFWDKTDFFDCLEMSGIRFVDGAGVIRSTYADSTVSGYRVVENCRFERFTQCAIGHRNTDSPYWSIRDCAFAARFATDDGLTAMPAASAGTIAVALSGLVDTVNIEDCDFYCYQVGVKLGLVGANAHIKGGNFLRYAAYTTFPRTDVWLPPWPENPYATGIDAGNGFTITETKFGNEGKDNADFCVLYADAAAGNFEAALPVYTASAGYVVGHTIDRVVHSCNATGEVPLVHSTTPNIFGCTIGPVFQSGATDVPLLRILNATGIDTDYWGGNIVGPVNNGLNNQFTPASEADYVTAVTGTIPFQPQNARNSRVNSYRGTGARQLIPETKLNTATGSTNTFTLPQVLTLAKYKGVEFIFKNEGSGLLTITGATNSIWAAAQVTSYTIAAGAGGRLICDGTHWVTF